MKEQINHDPKPDYEGTLQKRNNPHTNNSLFFIPNPQDDPTKYMETTEQLLILHPERLKTYDVYGCASVMITTKKIIDQLIEEYNIKQEQQNVPIIQPEFCWKPYNEWA